MANGKGWKCCWSHSNQLELNDSSQFKSTCHTGKHLKIFIKLLTGRVEKVVNLIQFNSNCRFGNLLWGMVKNVVKSTWFNSNQMIWLLYSKPVILKVYMQGTYKIYHNLLWIDLTKDESSWIESDWMKVYL